MMTMTMMICTPLLQKATTMGIAAAIGIIAVIPGVSIITVADAVTTTITAIGPLQTAQPRMSTLSETTTMMMIVVFGRNTSRKEVVMTMMMMTMTGEGIKPLLTRILAAEITTVSLMMMMTMTIMICTLLAAVFLAWS